MKITDIYKKYKIPKNLQNHQLRVASVASFICDHYDKEVDKKTIVSACLLHDMGNILKFNFDLFPEFLEPQGRKYWEGVRKEFVNKYGFDSQQATIQISRDIGVDSDVEKLITNFSATNDFKSRLGRQRIISVYSDLRVAPKAIVSIKKRFEDGRRRYVEIGKKLTNKEFKQRVEKWHTIEKPLFERLSINPEDINGTTIKPIIKELNSFDVTSGGSPTKKLR